MNLERAKKYREREKKIISREMKLKKQLKKLKIEYDFIFKEISYVKDNVMYVSKSLIGWREINPHNFQMNMFRANGQFAIMHLDNYKKEDRIVKDEDDNKKKEIDKVLEYCNPLLYDYVFSKNSDPFFPRYLGENKHFYKMEYIGNSTKLVDILTNPITRERGLKDLYKIFHHFKNSKFLPGNDLHDFVYVNGVLRFNHIEDIVYNYYNTYRMYLWEIENKELEKQGTIKFKKIDFIKPGKSSKEFIDLIKSITLKDQIKDAFIL